MNSRTDRRNLAAVCVAIAAALVAYSQTDGFAWDEGFHLLAARLIEAGKRPYADFLFAQVPLNAYWNALLMRIAGVGWRLPHLAAALETGAAIWLIAGFAKGRAAIMTALLVGLNEIVVWYATLPQSYGICMLLGAAGFRCCVAAVEGPWWQASLAGMFAGAAASSSLLAAPIGPIFFVWLSIQTRWRRSAVYVAGAAVGLSPVIWSLATAPRQFVFDVAGFHVFYRQVEWSGWAAHDAAVVTSWLDSGPGLILFLCAAAGAWTGRHRREIALAAWTAGLTSAYIATAHPTFPQYFTVAMPFAGFLASVSLERFESRRLTAIIAVLAAAALAREIWQEHGDFTWATLVPVARKVKEVTPPGARVLADEHIYLLTGIMPPSGLEWRSAHKIEIPMDQAKHMHVIPQSELDKEIKRGDFAVLETCEEDDVKRLGMRELYKHTEQIGDDCFVLWGPIRP